MGQGVVLPYLLLLTGIWHMKICSSSIIVSHLMYLGTILPFFWTPLWQESVPHACTQTVEWIDNGHTSS